MIKAKTARTNSVPVSICDLMPLVEAILRLNGDVISFCLAKTLYDNDLLASFLTANAGMPNLHNQNDVNLEWSVGVLCLFCPMLPCNDSHFRLVLIIGCASRTSNNKTDHYQ